MNDLLLIIGLNSVILINLVCWYTLWSEFAEEKIKWGRAISAGVAHVVTIDLFYNLEGQVLPDNIVGIIIKLTLMAISFYVAYLAYNNKKILSQ